MTKPCSRQTLSEFNFLKLYGKEDAAFAFYEGLRVGQMIGTARIAVVVKPMRSEAVRIITNAAVTGSNFRVDTVRLRKRAMFQWARGIRLCTSSMFRAKGYQVCN